MTNVNDGFSQDPALVQGFLTESEEVRYGMDQDMVVHESAPDNGELLNRMFRAMHTLKGTAELLGYDLLVRLSHRAEDVLNALRQGEAELNRLVLDPAGLLAAAQIITPAFGKATA